MVFTYPSRGPMYRVVVLLLCLDRSLQHGGRVAAWCRPDDVLHLAVQTVYQKPAKGAPA